MNEQFITAMKPISPWGGIDAIGDTAKTAKQSGVDVFKGIFEEAVTNARKTDENLVNKQYQLATGQIEDAHSVMIAASQAQLSVDMLVSLRNRALESYNELMRIAL